MKKKYQGHEIGISAAWTVVVSHAKGQIWEVIKGHWSWGQNSPDMIRTRVNIYPLISLTALEVSREGANTQCKLRNAFVTYSLMYSLVLLATFCYPAAARVMGQKEVRKEKERRWRAYWNRSKPWMWPNYSCLGNEKAGEKETTRVQ